MTFAESASSLLTSSATGIALYSASTARFFACLVQHLNRAVDEVRRQSWRQLSGQEKTAFKRTRWLWLKNPWNLKPEQKRRLSQLCRKNQPIVRAYYLKEASQRF